MYKSTDYEYKQLSFINFNMACGMQLDMNNEWIHIAQQLPWRAWETLYVSMFPSNTVNVAKPCRMVLGSLILQTRMGFSDRELVDQLRQNPYYRKSAPLSVHSWVTSAAIWNISTGSCSKGMPRRQSSATRSLRSICCMTSRSTCMTTRRIWWKTES